MGQAVPSLSPARMIAALKRAGFVIVRIKGSHHFLQRPNDKAHRVLVAYHNKELPPAFVRAIVRQAGMTIEDFLRLL